MYRKLRYRFDEPFRIRRGVGLSPIRNKREEKALIEFCREQLKEEHIGLNPKRKEIYETTVSHYEEYGFIDSVYVDDHIGWYWS